MTPEALQAIEDRCSKAATRGALFDDHGNVVVKALFHAHDREFYRHAREDIPALVQEVKRLTARLEETTANRDMHEAYKEKLGQELAVLRAYNARLREVVTIVAEWDHGDGQGEAVSCVFCGRHTSTGIKIDHLKSCIHNKACAALANDSEIPKGS